MAQRFLVPAFILALAVAGCGAAMAPTPYTAAEIRAATRPGRSYEFQVEAEGKPTVRRVITFLDASDQKAQTKAQVLDTSGKVIDDGAPTHVTWEELRRHAEFPRDQVAISEERVSVPAGTWSCVVYTVTEGSGAGATVRRFYFAKELPGAPILFTTEKGGRRVMTSTLVGYRAGK